MSNPQLEASGVPGASTSANEAAPARTSARVPHMPALDGARGIFVILGPVIYHLRPKLLPGGILCLDLFFVLSSFLIIRLLLSEWDRTGTINLKAYAGRRARRLLPALIPTLGLLALYLVVFGTPEIVDKWAAGIASSLTYMMNWLEIWRGNSYWDAQTAESPVRHLWSFAVEEQFYLFAPLLMIFCLRRYGATAHKAIVAICAIGIVLSTWLMAFLHHPGQDPTRSYYGTDTRAHTILVGIILAVAVHRWGPIRTATGRLISNIAGTVCTIIFVWMLFIVDGQSSWMFEYGGFLLVALLTAAIIFSCSQPTSWLHPIFAHPWAMAAGVVSYGIYLFHQPINKLFTEDLLHFGGWPLDIFRFTLTMVIAFASFHLYEKKMSKAKFIAGPKGLAWALGGTAAVFGLLLFATLQTDSTAPSQSVVINGVVDSSKPPTGFDGIPLVDRPLRVLVVGDSVMQQVGVGLATYAASHPDQLVVLNKAKIGCGILPATEQRYSDPDGTVRQGTTDPACSTWPDEVDPQQLGNPNIFAWPTAVKWFRPDAVVMYPSPWDATDRKIASLGPDWVHPNQSAYDAELKATYLKGIDMLTSGGAKLYALTTPDLGGGRSKTAQAAPDRIARINQLFSDAINESGAPAKVIDYAAWLGTVGSERESELRPDGVHLSADGVTEFSDLLLKENLLARS